MAVEHSASDDAAAGDSRSWLVRAWRSRWFWLLWVLAACTLLGLSETLWLWHSWPVRELLDTDVAGGGLP
ncbi:amiloride-sensitive sodium channel family protein [Ramlibacter sp. RBP-2]|uniref:Amiloride-sensitive sodium channel family protein n=1 Tax=Ramlibacter lithotrophicus TaxID=2606681 RepID=A0A7X6DI03_9BURK|nr:amiloride-sensitive sodium channel family protein [Ramlibacter lithotrophicus]NKE67529.1 amiloride-sensitive sodium channel family protein [Ramlibacter lithotrophicus]